MKIESLKLFNRIKWTSKFQGSSSIIPPFKKKSKSIPPNDIRVYDYIINTKREIESFSNSLKKSNFIIPHNNFNIMELKNWIKNEKIIIKPADKNLGLCLLSLNDYKREVKLQLDSKYYQKVDFCPLETLKQQYLDLVRLIPQKLNDKDLINFLIWNENFQGSRNPLFLHYSKNSQKSLEW